MRLEVLGQIVMPQAQFEKVDTEKLKITETQPVSEAGTEDSGSSTDQKQPKLGKILTLIKDALDKDKKKQNENYRNKALKAYQKVINMESSDEVKRELKIKV